MVLSKSILFMRKPIEHHLLHMDLISNAPEKEEEEGAGLTRSQFSNEEGAAGVIRFEDARALEK